ncbi:MAG TPA: SgcJ/EcaC family oxidoreductase [Pyrinomonadaceae bacterium]|jgi:uncharacterized protein (TIGR02246 family)
MLPHRLSRISVAILMSVAFVMFVLIARLDGRAVSVSMYTHSVHQPSANDIAKVSEQWAREWKAKNLDALIALYAEDAVFMPATGSRVTGRAEIRELFEKALAVYTSDLQVHSKVTEESGDLAYDSGEYDEMGNSGGVKRSGRGNYLMILRRDRQNQWRIVQHMWTDVPKGGQSLQH